MFKKALLTATLLSGLLVPATAGVHLPPESAIVKHETRDFYQDSLLAMPFTLGILPKKASSRISFVGAILTTSGAASLTALTGGIDTAARAGDLVIVHAIASTNSDVTFSLSGYTSWADQWVSASSATSDPNLATFAKFMGGTPDTTAAMATGASRQIVTVWRNVNPTTPLDTALTTNSIAASGSPSGPAITTVSANAMVINQWCCNNQQQTGCTTPSGYTLAEEYDTIGINIYVAFKEKTAAGTETPGAWGGFTTNANQGVLTTTIALRPA